MITDVEYDAMELMIQNCDDPDKKEALQAMQNMLCDISDAEWDSFTEEQRHLFVDKYLYGNTNTYDSSLSNEILSIVKDLTSQSPSSPGEAFRRLCEQLPGNPRNPNDLWSDGSQLLSPNEELINQIADLFEGTYCGLCMVTGYYDPEEDARNGDTDEFTGSYYLDID